ncbi:hypothetical protein UA08_02822 [Talaromyces atroroseus]|uniref:Uncharacterized protein n=1 Tax=Talaromyces atroroseus TaxID=1441469 RepID=A0A225AL92_TALAT|nr:hypothetical protein UA08_02822 [Talaromyces atroroseus]OKL62341.1 hypothetical protein UA08_02822 [Talaromyces atroroseus]
MAHQAEKLAWNIVVQNLDYYSLEHPEQPRASNLFFPPPLGAEQSKVVRAFAASFSRTLTEQISLERAKYQESYDPPNEDDLIIDDATARRISPTVAERTYIFHEDMHSTNALSWEPCHHTSGKHTRFDYENWNEHDEDSSEDDDGDHTEDFTFNCKCALPLRERKAHSFLRQYRPNGCYEFYALNEAAYFNIHVVKALLVRGEMEPVLRVCSHPNVDYWKWQNMRECECMDEQLGWDRLYILALRAYLTLNILYRFLPALQSQSQEEVVGGKKEQKYDYRNTELYQRMLYECTREFGDEVASLPHKQFFGIPDEHYHESLYVTRDVAGEWPILAEARVQSGFTKSFKARPRTVEFWEEVFSSPWRVDGRIESSEFPFGCIPFDVFLNCGYYEIKYLPHETEVAEVWSILRTRARLPDEITLLIMEFAGYSGRRRSLPIAHDPLNPANKEELERYLDECWGILVRCGMFAEALGHPIDWEGQVTPMLRMMLTGPNFEMIDIWRY